MRLKADESNLEQRMLTFIGYCLPLVRYRLSYGQLATIFEEVYRSRYSIATLRKQLSLLRREGLIATATRYRKKIPRLTHAGALKISPLLPYRTFGNWDGRWRVVVFHSPEKEQKYSLLLQKKMREMGWKAIRSGVFISPHPTLTPIKKLATDFGISQHLTMMEVERLEQEKRSIANIWQLDEINEQYRRFIKQARRLRRKSFWPLRAKELERQFVAIYGDDPHLPDELLPSDWLGKKAYALFKEITRSY